ncbi:MAG: hypothetical protein ACRD3T_20245 [Terriglobia bacterium]
MSGWGRLNWTLVGAGALAATAIAAGLVKVAGSLIRNWRRKSPEEIERLRRLDVNRRGRLASAQIVDWIERSAPPEAMRLVVYKYEVGGVTYEAAQEVSALPHFRLPESDAECLTASIKFDPKKPTNSIIVCEDWCGLNPQLSGPRSEAKG